MRIDHNSDVDQPVRSQQGIGGQGSSDHPRALHRRRPEHFPPLNRAVVVLGLTTRQDADHLAPTPPGDSSPVAHSSTNVAEQWGAIAALPHTYAT